METIYRIQDKKGRGPYKPGFTDTWRDEDGHPWPVPWDKSEMGKGILNVIRIRHGQGFNYGFGFDSLDQLRSWFSPSELSRLYNLDYRAVEMRVDEVYARTKNQLLFFRQLPLFAFIEQAKIVVSP